MYFALIIVFTHLFVNTDGSLTADHVTVMTHVMGYDARLQKQYNNRMQQYLIRIILGK